LINQGKTEVRRPGLLKRVGCRIPFSRKVGWTLFVCEELADFDLGQDEGLKNLMMAWYYAGYYTAQYEEQQRKNQTGTSS
jgi:hypothetical protein